MFQIFYFLARQIDHSYQSNEIRVLYYFLLLLLPLDLDTGERDLLWLRRRRRWLWLLLAEWRLLDDELLSLLRLLFLLLFLSSSSLSRRDDVDDRSLWRLELRLLSRLPSPSSSSYFLLEIFLNKLVSLYSYAARLFLYFCLSSVFTSASSGLAPSPSNASLCLTGAGGGAL